MIQRLEFRLNIPPIKREFEIIAKEIYELFLLLKNARLGIEPNYEAVWQKSDAELFECTYENVYKVLKSKQKGDGDELGIIFGFFSSLVDEESAGISLCVGCSNELFQNWLKISFPRNLVLDAENIVKIQKLFKNCIELLHPYYGEVRNTKNSRRHGASKVKGIPSTVHWLNYYASPELLDILEKAEGRHTFYKKEKFQDGYCFQIQELPIDDDNEEHIKLQAEINGILGL